jgi:hypothetical protein
LQKTLSFKGIGTNYFDIAEITAGRTKIELAFAIYPRDFFLFRDCAEYIYLLREKKQIKIV